MLIELGLYQHYKGNQYEVIGVARHSETLEPMVIYRACYGEHEYWVRPLPMFIDEVMIENELRPRFKKISTEDS